MAKYNTLLLQNGVRLVLAEDKEKNQTYAEIIVSFGGSVEKYKYNNKKKTVTPGLAHLMEHYLVENNLYGNVFSYFKNEFVDFNATTSGTKTCFFIDTVYDFERHLEELIKIVNIPQFDEKALEKTKLPIIEEIKRTHDRPYTKFNKKMCECSYYYLKNRETTGNVSDVKSIKISDLKEIHDLFYVPKNQTIFLAGNFDTKKVIKLIEEIYNSFNHPDYNYEVLDKLEIPKVRHKRGHVIDPDVDELINISYKIDLSKLTPKERVKSTFYLHHFLQYNFNDSSSAYQTLSKNKDTIYSITTGVSYFVKDICFIDIGMYGTNLRAFKKIVFDVIKNKYVDEEMFDLWKQENIINMIIRDGRVYTSGRAFLDNILTFDYLDIDKISDLEDFNLNDYKEFLNKLDFSNFTIVRQTKK